MVLHAPENVSIVQAGTKSDLAQDRAVDFSEGDELSKKYNIKFLEVSSYENTNVDEIFEILAQEILKKKKDNPETENMKLTKQNETNSQKKKCKC